MFTLRSIQSVAFQHRIGCVRISSAYDCLLRYIPQSWANSISNNVNRFHSRCLTLAEKHENQSVLNKKSSHADYQVVEGKDNVKFEYSPLPASESSAQDFEHRIVIPDYSRNFEADAIPEKIKQLGNTYSIRREEFAANATSKSSAGLWWGLLSITVGAWSISSILAGKRSESGCQPQPQLFIPMTDEEIRNLSPKARKKHSLPANVEEMPTKRPSKIVLVETDGRGEGKWKAVEGTVKSCEFWSWSTLRVLLKDLEYEFEVDGKKYVGNKACIGSLWTYVEPVPWCYVPKRKMRHFVAGRKVTVYYNPINPNECTLVRGVDASAYGGLGMALLIAVLAAIT